MDNPAFRTDTGRNPDGTFKPGVSGNPSGRPKNTMKSYIARKLDKMTDEEKEAWLAAHKISGIDMWKMAEGNPQNDVTSGGEPLSGISPEKQQAALDAINRFLDGNK